MKTLGKITVKHFLNTNISTKQFSPEFKTEDGKITKSVELYPLYVKITFMRKTTQMKSIVNENYANLDKANFSNIDLLNSECKMIKNIILNEYTKSENNFSLIGIADKCKVYHGNFLESVFNTYLWQDYNKAILKTRSKFMRLLLVRNPNIPSTTFYEAAIKLVGEKPELKKLKEKFENYQTIEKILKKEKRLNSIRTIEWKYGNEKENFVRLAIDSRFSYNEFTKLVDIIDTEINKIMI